MGLESGTFLDDLVITNPLGASDKVDKGDDHIRLIKTLLKNSFPDVDQAVSTVIFNAVEPALKRKGTLWGDETLDLLKIRNKGDTAFITLAISLLTDNSVDVNAGTIDGATIGAASPSSGVFTTLQATTLDSTPIGSITPSTGKFTTLETTDNITVAATKTVDGRDVSVDGTKLDGIQALAQVNRALASQPEAEAGIDNVKGMTPLRTKEAITSQSGSVLLATVTASNSVVVDFTNISSIYLNLFVLFDGIVPATDDRELQIFLDYGAGFIVTGYRFTEITWNNDATSVSDNSSAAAFAQIIGDTNAGFGLGNAAGERCSGKLELFDTNVAGSPVSWISNGIFGNSTQKFTRGWGLQNTNGALSGLRFKMASGNITSGEFKLYGIK